MDDRDIIALYWQRAERAIHETAAKYGGLCYTIAHNILSSREDSEECVNDTYLGLWNAIPPQRPSILPAFLGTITRNLSFNRYKYNTAGRRGGGETAVVLEEIAGVVSGADDVEQEINRKELIQAIDDFLASLPAHKRKIFVCRYWYFDPVAEIAVRSGMTENHVSVTLNRLRAQLRRCLTERGFDL